MSRSSSAVVDSKVVEMSLDNQNFEKNAQISMATLKKLQEALDFSNSTDGLDKVNASVKKVKFDPLLSGIEQAKSGFSALEAVAFGAFANIGAKIENYAEKVAFAIPRQMMEGGKSRAFNMEQAKFMINGLAEQTGATFEDVKDSIENAVTGTAYGFDEAATAASQLLASSVQVGEQMDHALLSISGVAAMTGSSYGEIAHIFTTIAGNGKVMTEQLNQFSVRGLNAAAALASQMNVTEEEVREMVHKGQIDFQTFADAMDSAFGEHAKDANKTFSGSFANIKAVFSRMGQSFIAPGMESMTKVFNHLLPLLKEVEARVKGIAERVMPYFDDLADGVSGAIDIIYTALTGKDPVKEAADSASEATEQTLSDIENIRKTAIDVIRGDYGNGLERVNKLTEAGFDAQQVQDYVNKIHELTGGTWDLNDAILAQADAYFGDYQALSKLSDDELKAAGMSDEDITNLRESAKALEEVAENTEVSAEEMETMDVRTRFIVGLQKSLGGLSEIFGKIGDVITSKFGVLKNSDFDVLDFLSTKFLMLSQTFSNFAAEHSDDIANIFGGIVSAALMVVDVFRSFGKGVWSIVSGVFDAFGTNVLEFAGWIGETVSKIQDWFAENKILDKGLQWLRQTVSDVSGKVRDFFDGFIKLPALHAGFKKIQAGFKRTFTGLPKHFEGTKKAFGDFMQRVKDMGGIKLSNVLDIFKDFKDNVIGQFLDFEPFKKIKEGVADVTLNIKKHFDELSVDAEGNETAFGKVWHTVSNVYDWIAEKTGKVTGKISKFWDDYKLGDFFEKQWLNLSMGLEQLGTHLVNFFKGLPEVFGNFWDLVNENGGFSFDNIDNIFSAFKETFGKYFKNFHGFDGLKAAFALMKEDAKAKLLEMGIDVDKIAEDLVAWKDKIVETIKGIPAAISDFSLPEALQKFINFLSGGEAEAAQKGAEGVGKSVDEMNQTITSSMDKKFMDSAMPIINFFSEEVAAEIQENADTMDESTKGFFGQTLGHYLPGVAAVLDKVFGDLGVLFINVFENMSTAFGELEPGWIWKIIKALLGFGSLFVLGKVATSIARFVSAISMEKKANAKNISATAWLKRAAAIAIIAGVIYGLAQMPVGDLIKGGLVVAAIVAAMIFIDKSMTKIPKGGAKGANNMLDMAKAIAILAIVAFALSLIDGAQLLNGLVKVIAILAVVWVAQKAFSKIPPEKNRGLLEFAETVAILAAIAVILSFISWGRFLNGMLKLAIIAGLVIGVLALMGLIRKKLAAPMAAVKGLAVLFGVLTVCFIALSFLKWPMILKGVVALGAIAAILVATLAGIAAVNKILGPAQASIRGLALLFGVMAASLIAISFIESDKLMMAVGAITILSLLAVMLSAAASQFDPALKSIAKMALLLGMMVLVLAVIDKLNIDVEFETIASLSLLMVAVATSMVLIGYASKAAAGISLGIKDLAIAFVAVIAILGVIGLIAGLLGSLGGEKLKETLQSGIDILTVLVNGIVGIITGAIQTALNALPAMADAIVAFMEHLAKINDVPLPDLGKCIAALGYFLGAELMGLIAGALDWIMGDQMTSGMNRLPGMADKLVEFMDHLAALNDVSVPGLGRFGMAIVAFIGAEIMGAISGALEWLMGDQMTAGMNRLPGLADKLVEFMTSLTALNDVPYIKFGKLMSAITAFIGAEIMGAISGALDTIMGDQMTSGMNKLPGFATKLVTFYQNLTALNDLPYVKFGKMASLIGAVVAADFTGLFIAIGDFIAENISGEEGKGMMDTFTEDLGALATAIVGFKDAMAPMEGVTLNMQPLQDAVDAVTSANEAGLVSSLTTAFSKFITGDQRTTIQTFGDDIKDLGAALVEFQAQFGSVKVDVDSEGITQLVKALEQVKGAEGGGLIGAISDFFSGDVTEKISSFKEQMPLLGEAITAFNDSLGTDIDPEALTSASEALAKLGEFAEAASYGFMNTGGFDYLLTFVQTLTGTVAPELNKFVESIENLEDFSIVSSSMESLGNGLNTLSTVDLDTGDIANGALVESMKTNVENVASMIDGLKSIDTSGVTKFTNAVTNINGLDLDKAAQNVSKKKSEDSSKESAQAGINAAKSAFSSDTSVASAASGLIDGALSAIKSQTGAFSTAGNSLVVALSSGIILSKDTISKSVTTAVSQAVKAAGNSKSEAKGLGGDFARGYASGITENTSFVTSAAKAMVERAARSAKQAQDSNSPSKLTYKFGRWFVQGYKNAIHDYASEPAKESRIMTEGTVEGMANALDAVADMIDSEDDFQPTITPILDLSEIESRASSISSLLDTSPVIGANLGVVSTNTSAMKQAASMVDVLSAMEDLGNTIGSARAINNYNVNGVTYDDGSNVATAVGDLIRAARIERRA